MTIQAAREAAPGPGPVLRIDRRFCGPAGSGNGGYTAGLLAAALLSPGAAGAVPALPRPSS